MHGEPPPACEPAHRTVLRTLSSQEGQPMKLLTRLGRSVVTVVLLGALAHSAAAQIPGLESSKAPQPEQAEDPLGRTTPRGTISAFIRAVDRKSVV